MESRVYHQPSRLAAYDTDLARRRMLSPWPLLAAESSYYTADAWLEVHHIAENSLGLGEQDALIAEVEAGNHSFETAVLETPDAADVDAFGTRHLVAM